MGSLLNVSEYCVKYAESSKIKDKKEILKQIPTLLDVPKVVQQLDANTLLELSSNKSQVYGSQFCTWSTLVKCLIAVDRNKRSSYKKELPDALKIVIKTADQQFESGPRLLKCANDFFKHICETLEDDDLYKCFSTDYSQILLDLVQTAGYIHLMRPKTFESLLAIYTYHLLHLDRSSSVDVAYDPNLNARVLFALVSGWPFDLSPFCPKLMKFFEDFFSRYPSGGTKISVHLFSTINHLFLTCGPNMGRSTIASIYPSLHKFALSNSTTTQIQLKEQIDIFWRVVLRLDIDFAGLEYQPNMIISKDNLQSIADVVMKDLAALHTLGPHTARKPLSRHAREEATLNLDTRVKRVLELAADVLLRSHPHVPTRRVDSSSSSSTTTIQRSPASSNNQRMDIDQGDVSISPSSLQESKRRRLQSSSSGGNSHRAFDPGDSPSDVWDIVLSEVCVEKVASPHLHTYTQLLWVLTTQHSREVPRTIISDIVACVTGVLERIKDKPDTEVWLLRVLESLAYTQAQTPHQSTWSSVWHVAVRRVHAASICAERALMVLRAVLRMYARVHAHLPFTLREVWKSSIFEEEHFNSQGTHMGSLRAALELIVDSSSVLKIEDRERLAKWVMAATEYLCRLEYSTLHTGGRAHLTPLPSAETLAQAQVLIACFLTPQQKIQLKPSPSPLIQDLEDNPDDFASFKTFRPLFEDNSVSQDVLHASAVQLPQSVQARIHNMCSTRLQSISTKLLSDCQDIASSKKKTLGVNKSHLCASLTDVLYFLQVLSHLEHITSQHQSSATISSSQSSNSQSSQKSRGSQQSSQFSISEEVKGMQTILAQTLVDHFSNACKSSDSKLLASLFSRIDSWFQSPQVPRSHSLHNQITSVCTGLFTYLKESVGLSATSSSQVSSPVKKKKKRVSTSQETDVFDLVDEEETEDKGTSGVAQGDLSSIIIRALSRISPCTHLNNINDNEDEEHKNICALGTVEDKLGKILEYSDNSHFITEICERILSEDDEEKVIRQHALLLSKAAGMLQDPLCASDPITRKQVLRNVMQCAHALIRRNYTCDDAAQQSIHRIFSILTQLWNGKKLHFTTRVQMLECLHELMPLDGLLDFQPLLELLLDSLSDPDIRVRMAAVPSALVFFNMFEDEGQIFSDINQRLEANKTTQEGVATIFAALVAIANETYRSDPSDLLRKLCSIAATQKQDNQNTLAFRVLATQAAKRIALALGMSTPRQLLESHLALLLASWLNEQKRVLTDFPFFLLECDSFAQFLQSYGGYVVAQATLMKDEAALNAIAQTLTTTPAELLKTHFTRVFAACFPLYYHSPPLPLAAEVCEKFLQKFLDETSINTLIPNSFNDLLSTLLLESLSFSPNPSPPLYTPSAVQQILEHLAKGWTVSLPDLLYRSRHNDRIQQVVLAINVAIARTQVRTGARMRLLNSFAFFVGLLADKLVRPPILREAILTLLRVLHYSSPSATITLPTPSTQVNTATSPQLTPASSFILTSTPAPQATPTGGADWPLIDRACEILQGICEKSIRSREGVKELCRELNAIVTTLVPLVQSSNVRKVIETLITAEYQTEGKNDDENNNNDQKAEQINKLLSETIRKLDPLPDSVGSSLSATLEIRRGVSIKAKDKDNGEKEKAILRELARLTDLPTPSNPSARIARLNNIHSTLSQLRELQRKSANAVAEEYTKKVKWGKLVRQLVEICKKGDVDTSVIVLATECLGCIPHTQELNDFSAHSTNSTSLHPHSNKIVVHEKILEMLNTYLADYDMEVVCEAANSLRSILHTETGATALKNLASDTAGSGVVTAEYLAPFTSKKPSKSLVPPTNRNNDFDILTHDILWMPSSSSAPHIISNSPYTPSASTGSFSMPAPPSPFPSNSVATPVTPISPSTPNPSSSSSSSSSPIGPLPSSAQGHTAWICRLASALATSPYVHDDILRLCGGVCAVRPDFAEFSFPHLIFDMLVNDKDKNARACKGVLKYFTQLLQLAAKGSVPRESVLLTLNTLNFLRAHAMMKSGNGPPSVAQRNWHTNFWDDVDYILVARAALRVGAHCTALLYMELWYEAVYGQVTLLTLDGDENTSDTEDSSKSRTRAQRSKRTASGKAKPQPSINPNEGQMEARELLLEIFSSIGEPDSFYGLTSTFDSIASQLAMYVQEQNWPKALGTYDMVLQYSAHRSTAPTAGLQSPRGAPMLSQSSNLGFSLRGSNQSGIPSNFSFHEGLMTSLQNMGHYHILDFYLKGFQKQYPNVEEALSEYKSQAAWRSGVWDGPTTTSSGFHSSVHQSLRALSSGDFASFKDALDSARLDTVRSLSAESTMMNISPTLANLRFLAEIDHAWEAKWGNISWHPHPAFTLKTSHNTAGQDFTETEPVYALYTVLAPLVGKEKELPELLSAFSSAARKAKRFQLASHAVYQLKNLAASTSTVSPGLTSFSKEMAESKLEEAKVLWGQGEETKGLSVVRQLLKSYKSNDAVRAEALLYTGKWLAHTRAERANIVEEHLNHAIHEYDLHAHGGERVGKAHFTLAHFSDSLYQGLLDKAASSEWAATQELRQHKERELALCEKTLMHAQGGGLSADKKTQLQELTRHTLVLRRVVEGDRQDSQRLIDDTNKYLLNALDHYIASLLLCDKYDVRAMFRVCSLWFNNSESKSVNTLMNDKGRALPAHKFLPLIYQITSRVSANPTQAAFQSCLCAIIERVAVDHPHHVMYQLFALKNGEIEHASSSSSSSTRGKGGKKEFVVEEDKVRAAKTLLARMQRGIHSQLINELSTLISAYIALTHVEHNSQKKPRSASYPLPSVMTRITSLSHVVVPTLHADSRVKVLGFSPNYTLCGGRSAPKIVECIGDDGKKYRQLVKGKDDLRQDAVMQQTFAQVNTILREAPSTASRRLHVRSYKVVPLTHCAGLLEWVSNTIPLGGYLVGPQGQPQEGAHYRYRKNDIFSMEIWSAMSNAKEDDKLAKFQECTDNFRPVFHHFFLEHFGSIDPATWHSKRLNYTLSVASNSIVGYIVGLGDRHAHNILIDCGSAELVHIDLGVAFEQGKMLRVPELVPFRLTRDIEDGMGITGVEGVFRRCCEETLKVLRDRATDLVTILSVFIHDPLYKWALDPLRALRLQRDDSDVDAEIEDAESNDTSKKNISSGNKDAERALLRLKQKLQGIEYGEALSIEGQVHTLINEARDPERLCKMYPGWAAWV